jgi:hypothetical protein
MMGLYVEIHTLETLERRLRDFEYQKECQRHEKQISQEYGALQIHEQWLSC